LVLWVISHPTNSLNYYEHCAKALKRRCRYIRDLRGAGFTVHWSRVRHY
jgi:hypothetical protein